MRAAFATDLAPFTLVDAPLSLWAIAIVTGTKPMPSASVAAIAPRTSTLMGFVTTWTLVWGRSTLVESATALASSSNAVATTSLKATAIATATKPMRWGSVLARVTQTWMAMACATMKTLVWELLTTAASATDLARSTNVGALTFQRGIATATETNWMPSACVVVHAMPTQTTMAFATMWTTASEHSTPVASATDLAQSWNAGATT